MTARAKVFLDTNILIYAAQGKTAEPAKFEIARRIVVETDFGTSAQVLAEFFANVVKKGARPLSQKEAAHWVRVIAKKACESVDVRMVEAGIDHAVRYQISYWDGTIVAAAERQGAAILYTEDLSHGQTYGTVRACNPFIEDFLAN